MAGTSPPASGRGKLDRRLKNLPKVPSCARSGAQAWQPRRPAAMKRKAGGVLHLWRILLAAAAATRTCASTKTSCAAQGVFRAGNRQSAARSRHQLILGQEIVLHCLPWYDTQCSVTSVVKSLRDSF